MDNTCYIDSEISKRVLNIGPDFLTAQGGIAQVAEYYNKYLFKDFNYLANSCGGTKFDKLICLIKSIFVFIYIALFRREIKVVHIHTSYYNSFKRSAIFVYLSKFFGLSPVMHIHSGAIIEYAQSDFTFVKKVLSKCSLVIVLADMWKQYFEKEMALDNLEVLENIVPVPQVNKQSFGDGKLHFLFLGRLVKTKGVDELIDAIIMNREVFAGKIVVHLCGDGVEEANLKSKIATAGIDNEIIFEGWIVDDEKIKLLNHCDVFILPTYFEGISISILESMAFRLPIITTDVGGNPTLVKNGINGLLIPVKSTDAVADSIKYFLDNPHKVKLMGESSSDIVTKFFPDNVSKHLSAIYSKLLS